MRPDIVKFHHLQLSFIDEKFHHISLPKTIQLFSVLFNAAVATITIRATISLFSLKLVLEPLKQKSQCGASLTRTFATFCHVPSHVTT